MYFFFLPSAKKHSGPPNLEVAGVNLFFFSLLTVHVVPGGGAELYLQVLWLGL